MRTARNLYRILGAFAATAFAFAPVIAHAQSVNLGVANDFNVFVFGDQTQSGADVQGRDAVGGNAYFDNGSAGMTIGTNRAGSTTDNLIVGGNYTNRYNTVYGNTDVNGNASWINPSASGNLGANGSVTLTDGSVSGTLKYGTTFSGPSYLASQATKGTTTIPIDFGAANTSLTNLSNSLTSYVVNGTTAISGTTINLTGTSSTLNVFSINASTLVGAGGLNINATAGSTVLVNVTGTSASFGNFQMTVNGTSQQNVLFNFNQATQINLTNFDFDGSILATKAAVSTTYGHLNGTLVANSLSGTMESHDHVFTGNLYNPSTAIPEAGTSTLLLGTLLPMGAVFVARRKK